MQPQAIIKMIGACCDEYKVNPAGIMPGYCFEHIVLDNYNLGDGSIDFCLNKKREETTVPKRNITLLPTHNTRVTEQWRIISERVDFAGKLVLDLMCGYGGLLSRAWAMGALQVWGIDNDTNIVKYGTGQEQLESEPLINFIEPSINKWTPGVTEKLVGSIVFDVVFCFSILSSLPEPTTTLHWIHEHSTQALIECRLAGDGLGLDWLKGPRDIRRWLDSIGWQSVERIGETTAKDQGTKRGIWLCQ